MTKKRILLATNSDRIIKELSEHSSASNYDIQIAKNGDEAKEKLRSFQPDLILLKVMLPKIHGIDLLSKIKKEEKGKQVGVFICSSKLMIQDYHAAMEHGADYFLEIPFQADFFFELTQQYFNGTLQPAKFHTNDMIQKKDDGTWYTPSFHKPENYIKFWGTRGSSTVAGSEYVRFGGNSCCLEVRQGNQVVIFDAGTGIRPLGYEIMKMETKTIHIFLGHTHWDHIIGFPFFEPLYHPDYEIHIWAPEGFGRSTKDLFTELLAYEFFPIRLEEVQAKLIFHQILDTTPVTLGDLTIDFHYTFHPGVTFGFKIQSQRRKIGYVTDNEMLIGYHGHPNQLDEKDPQLDAHLSMIEFFKNCDMMIHEAQYTPQEYKEKVGWGHSSISNAAILIKHCKVPEWFITHHDPKHTDVDLFKKFQLHKDIMIDCAIPTHVHMAYDGLILSI